MIIRLKNAEGEIFKQLEVNELTTVEVEVEDDEGVICFSENSSGEIVHSLEVDGHEKKFVIEVE
jgi:hypothetical protein